MMRVHTTLTAKGAETLANDKGYVFKSRPLDQRFDLNGIAFHLKDGGWCTDESIPFSLQLPEGVEVDRVTIYEDVSGISYRAPGMYELPNGAGRMEVLSIPNTKGAILLRGETKTLESARELILEIKKGSILPAHPYGEQVTADEVAAIIEESPLSPEVRANLDRAFAGRRRAA